MLKKYRRHFIAYNMALVGVVLLLTFLAQVVYTCQYDYKELRSTMQMVVSPWEGPGDGFRPLRQDARQPMPGGEKDAGPDGTPRQEDGGGRRRLGSPDTAQERIVTVFRNRESGEVSVMTAEDVTLDGEFIKEAVEAAAAAERDFGVLRSYGLIYYKEGANGGEKFAFAELTYLTSRILHSAVRFSLLYVVVMTGIFFISLWLSKLAARPMENAIERERRFVADISHDLKTPITVILANDSILKANPDDTVARQAQWIESTDEAAHDMMTMVSEMLTLSSLESPQQTVVPETVPLSSVVQKCVLQMESVAYDRGVALDAEIADGVYIMASRDYAQRIVSGLLENALKYEPDGGRVVVSLAVQKKKAVLTVRNEGSVIAPGDLPHIFDRFYRGDKTRGPQKGHGLGLPIVRQIAELIGAEIRAESAEGEGTTFAVTFETVDAPRPEA